jgi:hypothetical protein
VGGGGTPLPRKLRLASVTIAACHAQRRLDDDRRGQVGPDVSDDQAARAGADQASSADELLFAHGQCLPASQASELRRVDDADRHHDIDEAGPQGSRDPERQNQVGKARHGIHGAHDDVVQPAAAIGADQPKWDADQDRQPHGDESDAD